MSDIRTLLSGARVMPILTVHDADHAAPLAQALFRGGVKACEVTLRTPAALTVIAQMRAAEPALITGAGTIRTPQDVDAAMRAGAQFLVTPGTTASLIAAIKANGALALPGAASASEMLTLAEQAGAAAMLRALYGPMPDLAFCPTGGITRENAPAYLSLPNVVCVGGSWIAGEAALKQADFATIERLARDSTAI